MWEWMYCGRKEVREVVVVVGGSDGWLVGVVFVFVLAPPVLVPGR